MFGVILKVFLVILVINLSSGIAGAYTWYEFNGHYYTLTKNSTRYWTDAESEATSIGLHLVAINSKAEEDFLWSQFWDTITVGSGTYVACRWIGFTDRVTEGDWRWVNGDPVTYTNWYPGEPNNSWDEDYGCFPWNTRPWEANRGWNDVANNGAFEGFFYGIIESNYNPVPIPSALVLLGWGILGLAGVRKIF